MIKRKVIAICVVIMAWSFFSSAKFVHNNVKVINEQGIAVKAIYIDENNNKWFGTSQGLFVYDGSIWMRYSTADHLISDSINALTFEQSSYGPELWVATNKGVSVLAFDVDGVTSATSYTTESGVLGTNIADVAVDSRHNKIFGSEEGITFFQSGTMIHITYDDNKSSLIDAPVNDMAIANDSIYIGYDGGIGRLVSDEVDGITGASRWTSEYGITPLSGNIKAVEIDSKGNQWFGTDAGAEKHVGLSAKENWTLFTEDDGLVNNMVLVIREDADGSMWFGTFGGVSKLLNENWSGYTTAEGLVNDTVYDIAFEGNGTVWFATAGGISKMSGSDISDVDIALGVDAVITDYSNSNVYQDQSKNLVVDFNRTITSPIQLSVYDINGKLMESVNKIHFNGQKLVLKMDPHYASGIYFVKVLNDDGLLFSRKVLLLK